jgi:hypothetical protein
MKKKQNDADALTDRLNELLADLYEADVEACRKAVERKLPKSLIQKDKPNTLRMILQLMLEDALKDASIEERGVFLADLAADLLPEPSSKVQEIAVPEGVDGIEILKVLRETRDGVATGNLMMLVDISVFPPPVWGVVLHDTAKNIADGMAEQKASGKIVDRQVREAVLQRIAQEFQREHLKPTDEVGPYRTRLDS